MRITHADAYKVVVPAQPGTVNSEAFGPTLWDSQPKWIIEVHTDEGLTGYGESKINTTIETIEKALGQLRGVDLSTVCLQQLETTDLDHHELFGPYPTNRPPRVIEVGLNNIQHIAVQLAIFDLLGKKTNQPLSMMMGGAFRTHVHVDAWMGRMSIEDSARAARRATEAGFRGIKLKTALDDPVVDRAQAIKNECGETFSVTIDPNGRFYRPGDAMRTIENLAEVGNVCCLEDPFPRVRLEWFRELKQRRLIPVALHLSYGPALMEAIKADACDYMNLHGCPWDIKRGGDACFAAGISTWHGTGLDLGLIEASALHVCAATQSMTRPSDIFGRFVREHNLIDNPFIPHEGYIEVPTAPGLGVDLDHNAIERYCVDKCRCSVG